MARNSHWIEKVARSRSLPNFETLEVPPRTPTAEAWDAVMEHCDLPDAEVALAIADWFRLKVADPEAIDPQTTTLVPVSVARQHNIFPLYSDDRHLVIGTADPCDVRAEQAVGFTSGRVPVLTIAPPRVLEEWINDSYAPVHAVTKLLDRIDSGEDADVTVTVVEDEEPTEGSFLIAHDESDEGPIVKLTNMVLKDAVSNSASDIHIQPLPTGGVVRLRVDGVLRRGITVPLEVLARIISRIKIMSQLDISDRMRPQDGRTRVLIDGHKYDLRVSTVPVRGGEKAVIRILDPQQSRGLDDVGVPALEVKRMRRLLRNRDGILVVTGPTGSGKTTTMYAALREISSEDVNIMTVEDPVEYELPGLTQIQVDPKQGVTFQTALKAILRQDPDVIFVGEIRDGATAEMAAQASLMGHLVLATIHANDAIGSVRRFLDLGLDAGTISETLRGALAQRLVRTLCSDCAVPFGSDPGQAQRVSEPSERPQTEMPTQIDRLFELPAAESADKLADANSPAQAREEAELATRFGVTPTMMVVGCEECGYSGYRGRRPVVELIIPSPDLLRMVAEERSHIDLMKQARADGTRTLLEGALDLVREGLTTLAEVERVIGEGSAEPAPLEVSGEVPGEGSGEEPPEAQGGAPGEVRPGETPREVPGEVPDETPGVLAKEAPSERRTAVPEEASAMPRSAPSSSTLRSPPFVPLLPEMPGADLPLDETQAEPPRVLIVDDDPDARLLLTTLVKRRGWSVTEASDGKQALIALHKGEPLSLVVLDLGLPDIDGMDVLQIVKGSIDTAGLPVLVVTGRSTVEAERLALKEGASDFIRKPIDPMIFLTRAQAVLRRATIV